MKKIITLIILTTSLSYVQQEKILLSKLEKLIKSNSYKWKIAEQFYSLSKFYSKNRIADKSFIMLKRANDYNFHLFNKVYSSLEFSSLRKLKYWYFFRKIDRVPIEKQAFAYAITNNSSSETKKYRIRMKTLNLLISNNTNSEKFNYLFKIYENYFLIKEYYKNNSIIFKVKYRANKNTKCFEQIKRSQYTHDKNLIYEYFPLQKKSIYYFYYKLKSWSVSYQEINNKIKWELIE